LRRLAPILLAALLPAGCGTLSDVRETMHAQGDFSPATFCTDLFQRAYPRADFDIVDTTSKPTGLATTSVQITARRTDATTGTALSTDVAVECQFDHNVLTGFRWTKGPFG